MFSWIFTQFWKLFSLISTIAVLAFLAWNWGGIQSLFFFLAICGCLMTPIAIIITIYIMKRNNPHSNRKNTMDRKNSGASPGHRPRH